MKIELFTDGSIIGGNPGGIMGWSVIEMPHQKLVGCGRTIEDADNSSAKAELLGMLTALTYIAGQLELDSNLVVDDFSIPSDSQYAIGMLEKGWKVKANFDVVRAMRGTYQAIGKPRLVWVRGHASSLGNNLADKAARAAAEGTLDGLR